MHWTSITIETALGHYLTVPSIVNRLKYASLATVIDLVLGIAIAYVVVRTNLPGRGCSMRWPCCRSPCPGSCWPSAISR